MLKFLKNERDVELTSVCSLKPFDEKYIITQFKKKKNNSFRGTNRRSRIF